MARKTATESGTEKEGRVFLKRDADGNWRARWYGRWMANGKSRETSLCAWQGTPPDNPAKEEGNAAFERSRERARQQLKTAIDGRQDADEELRDAEKIHALRYGYKVNRVKLAGLAAAWDALSVEDTTEERRERVHFVLKRFVDFMAENFPNVTEAGALTAEHFKGFLAEVDASGFSARTYNDHLVILRSVLRDVGGYGKGFREFLAKKKKKREDTNTIHRRPFDGAELDEIFAAALKVDPELHPVLVGAACTALRRGDICRLHWADVDLSGRFVTVKTSKTGETVDIPIFPPFRLVLEEAEAARKKGVPYVWPKIALAYARNPDILNPRLQKVLEAAGFIRPAKDGRGRGGPNADKYEAPEDAEVAEAVLEDGMTRAGWTAKRKAKARRILALHFEGKNGKEIAEEIGTSAGGVSDYFREMEDAGHIALVSRPKIAADPKRMTLEEAREGEQRKRRGSLCGWHSFRTTFCTLALANGVPMEILRKITGHRTAEIVLKHYDRRGREATRKAFGAAMPKAIVGAVGGGTEIPPELAEMLATATPAQLAKVAKMLKGGRK